MQEKNKMLCCGWYNTQAHLFVALSVIWERNSGFSLSLIEEYKLQMLSKRGNASFLRVMDCCYLRAAREVPLYIVAPVCCCVIGRRVVWGTLYHMAFANLTCREQRLNISLQGGSENQQVSHFWLSAKAQVIGSGLGMADSEGMVLFLIISSCINMCEATIQACYL